MATRLAIVIFGSGHYNDSKKLQATQKNIFNYIDKLLFLFTTFTNTPYLSKLSCFGIPFVNNAIVRLSKLVSLQTLFAKRLPSSPWHYT